MALTKKEHDDLLKEIAQSGGDTDNMLKLLQRLRDDFDEREGMLRKEGETKDKETPTTEKERDNITEESREDNQEDGGLRRDPEGYRKKYEDLKRQYIERFFSGSDEEIKEEKKEEKKPLTYDNLFERK